ncbi:MAG: type II secretion system protein [Patescibacteria group bacterium]
MIKRSIKINDFGFTLIEVLVAISIIGFITIASMVIFKQVRMSSRDASRVANIATIKKALAMYLNDSPNGYPSSNGECLSTSVDVGSALISANTITAVPVDPMWPTTAPSVVENGYATSTSQNFCYYYFSNTSNAYKISYYLESNSKFGNAGINTLTF